MDTNGFNGDTFSSGFGDFYPVKRADTDDYLARQDKRRFAFFPLARRFKVGGVNFRLG